MIIRIRKIPASVLPEDTGDPKLIPVLTGVFCELSPTNKVSNLKLKCETLEISAVFLSQYSVLSCNL